MSEELSQTRIFTGHETVRKAEALIRPYVRETALELCRDLARGEGNLWLKLENQQLTGSFKVRGVFHRLLSLTEAEREAGIVAASAGNHGLAVACAAEALGISATIFLPTTIDAARKEALESYPAELRLVGDDSGQTERYAKETARSTGRVFISSYNDPHIISGQGTVGVEIFKELPTVETVILAVGGGALVSGVAAYLKAMKPEISIIAASPANSPAMFDLLAKTPEEFTLIGSTLSDSTAGPIEPGAITEDLCRALIDQWVLVEEEDIIAAMKLLFFEHRLVVEGAGAVAVAAYIKERERFEDSNTVAVVCGGNIEMQRFCSLVMQPPPQR